MAASEMAAGYVTRKSERHGKAFKEHFSPPQVQVPRFLESGASAFEAESIPSELALASEIDTV